MILDLQNAIAINPIDFNRFGEQFYECYQTKKPSLKKVEGLISLLCYNDYIIDLALTNTPLVSKRIAYLVKFASTMTK